MSVRSKIYVLALAISRIDILAPLTTALCLSISLVACAQPADVEVAAEYEWVEILGPQPISLHDSDLGKLKLFLTTQSDLEFGPDDETDWSKTWANPDSYYELAISGNREEDDVVFVQMPSDLKDELTLNVAQWSGTKTGKVLEFEPEYFTILGDKAGLPSIRNNAEAIAAGYHLRAQWAQGIRSERSVESLEDIYDKQVVALAGLVADPSSANKLGNQPLAVFQGFAAPSRATFTVHVLDNASVTLSAIDEERGDFQQVIDLNVLNHLNRLAGIVVAIGIHDDQGEFEHLGTGFVYKGKVITACHVVCDDRLWVDMVTSPEPTKRRFDRLRVRFLSVDDEGNFLFSDHAAKVSAAESELWPEIDTAALALDDTDPVTAASLLACSKIVFGASPAFKDEQVGQVYGVSSRLNRSSGPDASWMPPGRIIFPSNVARSTHPDLRQIEEPQFDTYYLRAVHAELSSIRYYLIDNARQVLNRLNKVWEAYRNTHNHRNILTASFGSNFEKLNRIAGGELGRDALPVFGTDLPSMGGNSGSPVFSLRGNKQLLIGMHVGIAGQTGNGATQTNLSNYGRTVPFRLIKERIDAE